MKTSVTQASATHDPAIASAPRQRKASGEADEQIHQSPRQLMQRRHIDSIFGEVAQRAEIEDAEPLQGKFTSVQRMEGDEDEGIFQGKFDPVQRVEKSELEEELPLQGKFAASTAPVQHEAEQADAPRENNTGMPDQLKANMEAMSGFDLSDVRVHRNSEKPAQLSALAYAQGNEIHLGPGQEQHLPHEAWHVVQQKQGRVQATIQMRGVGVNDSESLERDAESFATQALGNQRICNSAPRTLDAATAGLGDAQPMQLMTVEEYEQNVPDGKLQDLLIETSFEGDGPSIEELTTRFGEYIACIPLEVFSSEDCDRWKKALQMIAQMVINKAPRLPPNPYSKELQDMGVYRGTSMDKDGTLFQGADGSQKNTPCTPLAEVAALFALKAKNEGYRGVVAFGQLGDLQQGGFAFSPPDTMAAQEQEITVRASPKDVATVLTIAQVAEFVHALKTVGKDYSKLITSGVSTSKFDDIVKAASSLSPAETSQLLDFLRNPGKIDKWESYANEQREFSVELESIAATFARELVSVRTKKLGEEEPRDRYAESLSKVLDHIESIDSEKPKKMIVELEKLCADIPMRRAGLHALMEESSAAKCLYKKSIVNDQSDEEFDLFE